MSNLFDRLIKQSESEKLDFKARVNKIEDLLQDILCMANTPIDGASYLVIGVTNEKLVAGLEKFLESADINNFLTACSLNIPLHVQVHNHETNGRIVNIIEIPSNNGDIYALTKDLHGLRANHVYVRNGDVNTGKDKTAHPKTLRDIFKRGQKKEKFSNIKTNELRGDEAENIFNKFHFKVKDFRGWSYSYDYNPHTENHETTYFYKYDMDFIIKVSESNQNYREPWAQDAVDPEACSYLMQLIYKNIKISEKYYVSIDGGRYRSITPHIKIVGYSISSESFTKYVYFIKDSIEYDLNILINYKDDNLDSDELWIFGSKRVPIFNNIKEAEEAIDADYQSSVRKLLSYSYNGEREDRDGKTYAKYEIYPKS